MKLASRAKVETFRNPIDNRKSEGAQAMALMLLIRCR
jgi:hypothetical protein